MRRAVSCFAALLIGLATLSSGTVFGETLGFTCLSSSGLNATTGETQLSVEISQVVGYNKVRFEFSNEGPEASSICDIYFDDNPNSTLQGIDSITTVSSVNGVSFAQGAKPKNLPGANLANPKFTVTTGLSADSEEPVSTYGINPGESLAIVFNIVGTETFQDVLDDILAMGLRIGIHVQAFQNGGSESFISGDPDIDDDGDWDVQTQATPEPSSLVLSFFAMASFVGCRRFRRKQTA